MIDEQSLAEQPGRELVNALLYGRLEGVGEELLFLFARTGLVHLFSASGFHLAAASFVAEASLRPLRAWLGPGRPWLWARFTGRLGLMVFFGAATEWSSPMVRAFVFSALLAGAELLETRPDKVRVFLLSLVAAAALGRGGNLSFLLSALGMAGLLFVRPREGWAGKVAVALGPWLFTLPVTIWCFGLFSPLAPLWNLTFGALISWLVLPPAVVALVAASLGLPVEGMEAATARLMQALVDALVRVEAATGGALWVRPAPWAALALAWLAAASLWRRRRLSLSVGAFALAAAWAWPLPSVALLDVGQGDALLLRQRGAWTISDLGPPGAQGFPAPVTGALEGYGVGALSAVALSHFDLDHRGGLPSLLARHRVGALWIREAALGDKGALEVLAEAERAGVGVRFLTGVAAPPGWQCHLAPPSARGNDASPLCRAEADGGRAVLLTGDMGARTEEYFVATLSPFPRAELLKVAHHGSRFSSSEAFLRATGAATALIGVGRRNRYGHPSPEALARLMGAGLRVRRSDRDGTVGFYPAIW